MPAMHKSYHNKKMEVLSKLVLIVLLDILSVAVCYFFGLWVRFDFKFGMMEPRFIEYYTTYIWLWWILHVAVFSVFRLYSSIWVFAGTSEVFRILGAYFVLGLLGVFGFHFYGVVLPRSSCVVGMVFSAVSTMSIRFSYRLIRTAQQKFVHLSRANSVKNVMLVGAGDAGRALATEFLNSNYVRDNIVCVIDDNPYKLHKRLCGVPIVGDRYTIPEMVKRYKVSKIIYAIPSSSAKTR